MKIGDRVEGENFWADGFDACPDCGHGYFLLGPRGGMSRNIMCPKCTARFNVIGPFGVERIPPPKSVAPREYPPLTGSDKHGLCDSPRGGDACSRLQVGGNRHRGATKRKTISLPKSPPEGEFTDCDPESKA